jgi:hypothetical protein
MFPNLYPPAASVDDPMIAAAKIYVVPAFADLVPLFKVVVTLVVVGMALSAWAWHRRRPGLALLCLVGALGAGLAVLENGFQLFEPHRSIARLGRLLEGELRLGGQVLVEGRYENHASIDFYTGRSARVYRGSDGDLLYGSRYPEAGGTFVPQGEFERLWRGQARVFLLSDAPDCLTRLRALAPETLVLGRTGDNWLFANRARAEPTGRPSPAGRQAGHQHEATIVP